MSNNEHAGRTTLSENLIRVERLSEYLDVPIATIRDWCHKRRIPFVKVGHHVRFKLSDVQLWLAERSLNANTGN